MMKQLQEPVPSVLVERNDSPAAVGRVISRAMAKQPADRYQTVGELVEDLTIAAGVEVPAPTPVPMTAAANRIVVPTRTGENELLEDEVTVVRRRLDTTPGTGDYAVPAAAGDWCQSRKILIPALAGLLVVFAVVYVSRVALSRPLMQIKLSPHSSPIPTVRQLSHRHRPPDLLSREYQQAVLRTIRLSTPMPTPMQMRMPPNRQRQKKM